MLHIFCNGFSSVFQVFLQVFQMHGSSVSSVFRCMLQMFYLDVLEVDRVLHMLQWHRWLADSGLPHGYVSYLAQRTSPSPLLSLPSLPFPSLPTISPRQLMLGGETLPDERMNTR